MDSFDVANQQNLEIQSEIGQVVEIAVAIVGKHRELLQEIPTLAMTAFNSAQNAALIN